MADSRTAAVIASLPTPLANSYWVEPDRLIAGEYPGDITGGESGQRLEQLLAAGVNYFLDLTAPGELPVYEHLLPTIDAGRRMVVYVRKPIVDHSVPAHREHMTEILEHLKHALAEGHCIYVHCRAGVGRTGTVIGCHLVECGATGSEALARLNVLWRASRRSREFPCVPETDEQTAYVRGWQPAHAAAGDNIAPAELEATRGFRDRFHGALLGLAVGDALGVSVQYRKAGSFTPLGDLIGGGPFELPRGAWSDDTAMALCLAESLLERDGSDAADQVSRYRKWQQEGYLSATGQCVGITASVARALATAQWTGRVRAGSHDPAQLDKEALGRTAAPAMFAFADPERAVGLAAETCRITHQAPVVLDACRYFAALLVGALRGVPKERLLAPLFEPAPDLWQRIRLKPQVVAIAQGSYAARSPSSFSGSGNVLEALEAALWAFARTRNFREGALQAVNLGGDADVTGSVYGQLAGACYGAAAIPVTWRAAIMRRGVIEGLADRLLARALTQLGQ